MKNLTTHRTEGLTVFGLGGPSWKINQYTIDNTFIDFRYDVSCKFTSDWDLTLPPPSGLTYSGHNKIFDDKKDPDNIRCNYRIHGLISVEGAHDSTVVKKGKFPYIKREGKSGYDPLFARIESEQIKRYEINGNDKVFKAFNTVQQIIIEINVSNTAENERPLVFFYDGPQKFVEDNSVRQSKPVILNLNADFKGILYAPNSPVVIAGNGKNFEGFVVARNFVKLKTAQEFLDDGYKKVVRCKMNLVPENISPPQNNSSDENNSDENNSTDENNSVDNSPIIEYNADFEKYKKYVENNIFVKPEDILETITENNPEEIVKNYIQVKDGEKICYIRRDCKYFTELTKEKVSASKDYEEMKVPNIIIDSEHGDVQISGNIGRTVTYTETARDNDEPDKIFTLSDFNLNSTKYNPFLLVKFINYKYLNKEEGIDNMFEYDRGLKID